MKINMNGIFLDLPSKYNYYFQDPGTLLTEELILFHDYLLFYLIVGCIFVGWCLIDILINNKIIPLNHLTHNSLIEIIWTLIPAIILIIIAIPSFKLLYLTDEIIDPSITIKAVGWQWYWNYEFTDYLDKNINFDSYNILDGDLKIGQIRLLEVDNRLVLPIKTHIRILVTAQDVMHAFAIPSLGVRIDAIPGRVNSTSINILREGVYRGICAELCGNAHYMMPIVIEAVSKEEFINFLIKELDI